MIFTEIIDIEEMDEKVRVGKIPESVLVRSVLKKVKDRREEVLIGASVGEDCAVLQLKEDEVFVMSTDPITGTTKDLGKMAVHVTANDIASSGAEIVGIMLTILLPDGAKESDLKAMMEQMDEACEELKIQILGGHTEVTKAVNQPIITVTGVGKIKKDQVIVTSGAGPDQDVVLTKWIGLEGTSIIAKEKSEELKKRYPWAFVEKAKGFDQYISVVPEAKIATKHGVSSMHDVTEGGIFGALWELAESSGVGVDVDLKKIPVLQETIEICEYFCINPYLLISSGAMLMVSERGHDLVRKLEREGIHSVVIGKTTSSHDRVVRNGEEVRYLERPKTDELYQVVN